jgi:hypothetical protein
VLASDRTDFAADAPHRERGVVAGLVGKAQHHYERIGELIALGSSPRDTFQQLAEANDVSVANVKAGYARYAKENGFATPPSGGRSRRSPSSSDGTRTTASVPREIEPILDGIRKDRQSLNNSIDALVRWGQAQDEKVRNAEANAREVALRQIREAAASIN